MTPSQMLLKELEDAVSDFLLGGEHEGICTNEAQMKIMSKVAPCKKHVEAQERRKKRVQSALDQIKLVRDMVFQ